MLSAAKDLLQLTAAGNESLSTPSQTPNSLNRFKNHKI